MKPEAQRIAIAEACGIEDPRWTADGLLRNKFVGWAGPDDNTGRQVPVPDYLNDLNAMHEAEKVLSERQHGDFVAHLAIITGWVEEVEGCDDDGTPSKEMMDWIWDSVHATAAQRAEAFLKTLGHWIE